jgi:hypothetical protein
MNQYLDAGHRQPEDTIDMHPAVGEFVAAVNGLVDEHLTDDEVEGRLERVQQRAMCRPAPLAALRSLAAVGVPQCCRGNPVRGAQDPARPPHTRRKAFPSRP